MPSALGYRIIDAKVPTYWDERNHHGHIKHQTRSQNPSYKTTNIQTINYLNPTPSPPSKHHAHHPSPRGIYVTHEPRHTQDYPRRYTPQSTFLSSPSAEIYTITPSDERLRKSYYTPRNEDFIRRERTERRERREFKQPVILAPIPTRKSYDHPVVIERGREAWYERERVNGREKKVRICLVNERR